MILDTSAIIAILRNEP
jgi:ribonuclease VapC